MKSVIHTVKVLSFNELSDTSKLEAMRDQLKHELESNSLAFFKNILSEEGLQILTDKCSYEGDTEETTRKFYSDGKPFTYSERGNYLITTL